MKKIIRIFLLTLVFTTVVCAAALAEGILTLPRGLREIGPSAFEGDTAIASVVLQENVESIGSRAFADSSLKQITIPDGVTDIADDAFDGCGTVLFLCSKGSAASAYAQAHDNILDSIRITWVNGMFAPEDNEAVMEELNKISREKLGVEVEIVYMTSDEAQMSIAAGENYDMYFTCSWFNNFDSNVENGAFAEIGDMLQETVPALYASMPEDVWNLARSEDGGLYAIPIKKDYAAMNFIVYDAAIARDAGIEIPDVITSWDEMTPYLQALKAAMEEDPSLGQYPVNTDGAPAGIEASFDFIDRTPLIGVKYGAAQVICVLDDEEVVDRYRTMNQWTQLGLVNPAITTQGYEDVNSREHQIKFVQAWTGYDYSPSYGYEAGMTRFAGPFLSADGVKGSMTAFSASLQNDPARLALCLKLQELANTNKAYRDILAYGIPGVHFNYRDVIDENGNNLGQVVVRTEDSWKYSVWQFTQASYAVRTVEASEDMLNGTFPLPMADQWDRYFADCDAADVSTLGSFVFDAAGFEAAYAEIRAIKNEYMNDIQCGAVDPDTAIPQMRARMAAAGLNDIIAEAQRQLDAYLGR